MNNYPFVVNDSGGGIKRFASKESAIGYAEWLYNRSTLSVYVTREGSNEILYTLEY